ncbi:hypothetical protein KKI24_11620 [bacterium]|nr:hypothetical protein [bacterium]
MTEIELTEPIPDKWWERHEDEIAPKVKRYLAKFMKKLARKFGWKRNLKPENYIDVAGQLARNSKLTAEEILDLYHRQAVDFAQMDVFEQHYAHLCIKNEDGKLLIPFHAFPSFQEMSPERRWTVMTLHNKLHPDMPIYKLPLTIQSDQIN